jgi:hypothetical protein
MTVFSNFGKYGIVAAGSADPGDPSFYGVFLLLHCDGTDASTTFTDDSNSGKTITAVGNAAISTAQKKFGTGGLAVDGTGDYVSAPYSTDWDFGAGDFTIELFYRPDSTVGQHQGLMSCAGSTAQNGWVVGYFYTSNAFYLQFYDVGGAGLVQIRTSNFRDYISDNTWAHIAISRQGTAFRTFVDGALVSTTTSSYSPKPSVNGLLKVGTALSNNWSTVNYAKGYIDEARVTKGVARYTSAFTAPTSAFPNNGPASTVVMLHMNGSDGSTTFTDSSDVGRTFTAAGNAQIDTAQYKFGGASGLFDGTGDYITAPNSADFNFGVGDFTIEAWVRLNAVGQFHTITNQMTASNRGWMFDVTSGNKLRLYGYITSWQELGISTTSLTTGQWYHCAATREGTSFKVFLDGVLEDTTVISGAILDENSALFTVGHGAVPVRYHNGWIDDLRITKGLARYTATFTSPSAQLPDT